MKVIFLDIDGVLNSVEHHRRRHESGQTNAWPEGHIDPAAVEVLNEVVKRSGAHVVVSSTWRIGVTRTWMAEQLAKHGFKGVVLGMTPVIHNVRRGIEIQTWLTGAAPAHQRRFGPVTHFAILDDDTDMEHLYDHLVKVDDLQGLTKEYIPAILKLLEAP